MSTGLRLASKLVSSHYLNALIINSIRFKFSNIFALQLINFWSPNKLIDIDGKEKEWLPPKGKYATNYGNSEGMRYEAEAVRQSILAGELENKSVTYADSLLFAQIEDTIRKQIGVLNKYDEE